MCACEVKVVNNAIRFTEDIRKCDVWPYQYYKNGMICGIVFYRPTALDDTVLFWNILFHEGISSLMHLKWWHIITLIPGDASLRHWTRSYLVYVIALIADPLFGATYLHKPMMAHCQMDQQEYTLMKFKSKYTFFLWWKCIQKWRLHQPCFPGYTALSTHDGTEPCTK